MNQVLWSWNAVVVACLLCGNLISWVGILCKYFRSLPIIRWQAASSKGTQVEVLARFVNVVDQKKTIEGKICLVAHHCLKRLTSVRREDQNKSVEGFQFGVILSWINLNLVIKIIASVQLFLILHSNLNTNFLFLLKFFIIDLILLFITHFLMTTLLL